METYYCEYCGTESSTVSSLTLRSCHKHPSGANKGNHKLYEGGEKAQYTCKYCGTIKSSIINLTSGSCHRHPNGANKGYHLPAL